MPVAETSFGEVRGRSKGGTVRFLGIPYAAPPTGERRFRPPEPHPGWAGVHDASSFPPAALQGPFPLPDRKESTDESCLYLNVETPALDDARRPVLVFLHGGGFVAGAGSFAEYRGTRFVRPAGVVFVSVNYRLGMLGWGYLDHRFDELAGSHRCGLLDQLAALRWIHENIAAFGGDPSRITVCGQSAGAMSIGAMLRLFGGVPHACGAILQSGTPHHVVPVEVATRVADRVLDRLGVETAEELRAAPAQAIVDAQVATVWGHVDGPLTASSFLRFGPVDVSSPFDDELPWRPAPGTAPIPLIVGSNLDEWKAVASTSPPDRDAQLAQLDGMVADPAAVVDHYASTTASAADAWCALRSDVTYRLPAMRFAAEWSAAGGRAYRYLFAWRPPGSPLGAVHGREVPFAFGSTGEPACAVTAGPAPPAELEADMHERWVAFVAAGVPDRAGGTRWAPYGDDRTTMVFDVPGGPVDDPDAELRALWGG